MRIRLTTTVIAFVLLLATSAVVVITQRVTSTKDRPGYLGGGVNVCCPTAGAFHRRAATFRLAICRWR
jgi:hypothetical protein